MRYLSKDGVVGAMIFVTLPRDRDGWKGTDRPDVGSDRIPSKIGGFHRVGTGVGIESGYLCSANEGGVIMSVSSGRSDLRSKVPPEWIVFPSGGIGRFLDRG